MNYQCVITSIRKFKLQLSTFHWLLSYVFSFPFLALIRFNLFKGYFISLFRLLAFEIAFWIEEELSNNSAFRKLEPSRMPSIESDRLEVTKTHIKPLFSDSIKSTDTLSRLRLWQFGFLSFTVFLELARTDCLSS